ncbi:MULTISPECIES: putative amidoligase domain-containing protein [Paenibacillus]|uniref:putative amidoligase domain-containing protein n=1 Tax=Paenibacillus TaxID=44249 RepID=UPI000FD742D0|nr:MULTISPECIES: hypothetical protein [Paenibacillus]
MSAFLLHSHEPELQPLLENLRIPHGARLSAERKDTAYIIHWGAYHPNTGGTNPEALQPVKSILAALQPRRLSDTLRLHGIDCFLDEESQAEGEEIRWSHEFVVPVFDLQALTLFHRSSGVFYAGRRGAADASADPGAGAGPGKPMTSRRETAYSEIGLEQRGFYAVRAIREAVKSIYALGLDYGVVRIGVRPAGTLAVRGVEPVPALTPRLAELFADAMNRFDERIGKLEAQPPAVAMLGADPEFLLLNAQGKVKFASAFVDKDGPFGCDAIVLPSRRKVYPLAELRPAPSTDVRKLVVHLHRTLQLAAKRITDPELAWVAGGMPVRGFPLGGHIHFSGVELDVRLLRALDNYLALPLTLVEGETTAARKPQYGFLGDFRRQRHGGFEYRVLPSWMVSPSVAKGVLALAKLIAEHYAQLKQRPLSEPEVVKAYYRGDKARIRPLVPGLWRDMEKLPGYAEHESYLLPLWRMMLQMKAWNEREDIRPKWKITTRS